MSQRNCSLPWKSKRHLQQGREDEPPLHPSAYESKWRFEKEATALLSALDQRVLLLSSRD